MENLKHVGRLKSNKVKVVVAFKTLPGDASSCLVIATGSLEDGNHNALMNLVESQQAQNTFELGELLSVRYFPDGKPMLASLHADKKLIKIPTSDVEMTPTPNTVISLDELNKLIAEQRGVSVSELTIKEGNQSEIQEVATAKTLESPVEPKPLQASTNEVLSDTEIAKSLRSQADTLYKEAAKLRREADDLDPPKKKLAKVATEESA